MDWIDVIEREGAALSIAARHDPAAAVPACPGWDVSRLLAHVATTHRWAERIVRERLGERPERVDVPVEDSLSSFEAGVAQLVATLRATPPDTPAWTLYGPHEVAFWARRQAHETTIHRVDTEQATGSVSPIDPAVAIDGVDEIVRDLAPRVASRGSSPGGTVHLHATDVEGEWLVRFLDSALEVESGHAKGDAAVRGSAADLYLWLWGRNDGSTLEAFGDESLPAKLRSLTTL
jgi:uncharacterized protein (TIGR03083 family)